MSAVKPSLSALIDTCVFLSAVRDTLLRAAVMRLYRLYLSETILGELRLNLVEDVGVPEASRLSVDRGDSRCFPRGDRNEVLKHLIFSTPNHPKDRHVLAAAVQAGAQVIVTNNLKDFPPHVLHPYGITARFADDFLLSLFASDEDVMLQILREQAAFLKSPPMTVHDLLRHLSRQAAPRFAACIEERISRG